MIETSNQLTEKWKTFIPSGSDGTFTNGKESFNALSPIPEEYIQLGDGRELCITHWNPIVVEDRMGGENYLDIKIEGFIRLSKETIEKLGENK